MAYRYTNLILFHFNPLLYQSLSQIKSVFSGTLGVADTKEAPQSAPPVLALSQIRFLNGMVVVLENIRKRNSEEHQC
jgi:hypothetical protein